MRRRLFRSLQRTLREARLLWAIQALGIVLFAILSVLLREVWGSSEKDAIVVSTISMAIFFIIAVWWQYLKHRPSDT